MTESISFIDRILYTSHALSLGEQTLLVMAISVLAFFGFVLFCNNPRNAISNLLVVLLLIAISNHLYIIFSHHLELSVWTRFGFFAILLSYPPILLLLIQVAFIDRFNLKSRHLIYLAGYVFLNYALLSGILFTGSSRQFPVAGVLYLVFSNIVISIPLLIQILCLLILIKDWKSDLVEKRRRFRLFVLLIISIFDGIWFLAEIFNHYYSLRYWFHIQALVEIALVLFLASRLLKTENVFFQIHDGPSLKTIRINDTENKTPDLTELNRHMVEKKAYRQEKQSIGRLAKEMNIQEYQLRRLINQKLNYRNFNDFINQYRIEEAKNLLVSTDMQILNISMEVGFSSIASFNRVFRNLVQTTPSDYRKTFLNEIKTTQK